MTKNICTPAAEASIAAKNDFAEGLEDEVERFEQSFLRMREKLLRMAYQRHEVQRVTKVFKLAQHISHHSDQ